MAVLALMSAQSLGEYGAASAGVLARFGDLLNSTVQWISNSIERNTGLWIGAGVCLLVVFVMFRRR